MSMAHLAPGYHANQFNANRGQLIPTTAVEEPIVEHEHHHIHHHIDHGNLNTMTVTRREQRSFDDSSFEQERRYRTHEHQHPHHHHHHYRHRSNGSSRGYSRSDVDLSQSSSRRGSVQLSGTSDWTIIDVPPGTRRITLDTTGASRSDHEISWSRYNGVRRSRGLGSELWTEITKDLVTREAIEDLNYQYEETDHFYYVFEYLNREQIDALIHLTADIRRERARELEYSSLAASNSSRLLEPAPIRYGGGGHYDDHPEIVYTEEQTRRRSRKYYY